MATEKRNFNVHGINYVRTGECLRCGECCAPKNCPHFSWEEDGFGFCNIEWKGKFEVCKECTEKAGRETTHQICRDFPNHPFLRVIKDGLCSYEFTPATEKDKVKHQKLIDAWQ